MIFMMISRSRCGTYKFRRFFMVSCHRPCTNPHYEKVHRIFAVPHYKQFRRYNLVHVALLHSSKHKTSDNRLDGQIQDDRQPFLQCQPDFLSDIRNHLSIFCLLLHIPTEIYKIQGNIYFSTSAVRPYTRATIFIEVQSSGTRNFDSFAVNAIVKDITDRRIWMSEETVSSRTLLGRLRWFCTSKRNITVILKALSLFLVIESCMSRTLTAKANDVTCRTRAAQFYSNEYFQYLIQIFIARIQKIIKL